MRSLLKAFSAAASEHFPSSTVGVYPTDSDSTIAIVLVANKYSPQNFWNGRWRSTYLLDPSSNALRGTVKVDVHYYEDGNVRMSTNKKVDVSSGTGSADGIVREIAKAENKFQEELNRAFGALAEGSFKALRRQLPVTRQRVEWEKIGGYRVSACVPLLRTGWKVMLTSSSWARISVEDDRNDLMCCFEIVQSPSKHAVLEFPRPGR